MGNGGQKQYSFPAERTREMGAGEGGGCIHLSLSKQGQLMEAMGGGEGGLCIHLSLNKRGNGGQREYPFIPE